MKAGFFRPLLLRFVVYLCVMIAWTVLALLIIPNLFFDWVLLWCLVFALLISIDIYALWRRSR